MPIHHKDDAVKSGPLPVDGAQVAYVVDDAIRVVDAATGAERARIAGGGGLAIEGLVGARGCDADGDPAVFSADPDDPGLDDDARVLSLRGSVPVGPLTFAGEYAFQSGKRGQAVVCQDKQFSLSYAAPGNLNPRHGSLSLWVAPVAWAGTGSPWIRGSMRGAVAGPVVVVMFGGCWSSTVRAPVRAISAGVASM